MDTHGHTHTHDTHSSTRPPATEVERMFAPGAASITCARQIRPALPPSVLSGRRHTFGTFLRHFPPTCPTSDPINMVSVRAAVARITRHDTRWWHISVGARVGAICAAQTHFRRSVARTSSECAQSHCLCVVVVVPMGHVFRRICGPMCVCLCVACASIACGRSVK